MHGAGRLPTKALSILTLSRIGHGIGGQSYIGILHKFFIVKAWIPSEKWNCQLENLRYRIRPPEVFRRISESVPPQ